MGAVNDENEGLTTSIIFRLYYPLALSWIFMAIESPVAIAIISRLPNSNLNTAAFLIVMGLALWIESPVIDLLSTSTTLAKSHKNYIKLRTFALALMGWVTLAHFLVAWTPLYWFVSETLLHIRPEVAEAARIGLCIMVPWSAFIGWRRFHQGILIRFGRTKRIGFGTLLRMATMAAVGILLCSFGNISGIAIAATALLCSVAAEAIYVHFAAKSTIREFLVHEAAADAEELTTAKLLKFHFPLTATTAVMMLGSPVVAAALARAPNAVLAMAGWQVAQSLIWLHRTIVFALPEVVITLYKNKESAYKLKRFCIGVGLATSGALFLTGITRLDVAVFERVLHATPETTGIAHIAFLAASATPFLGALQSYVRGMLTAHHLTVARFTAVLVSMGCLAALLALTVVFNIAGVLSAAIALTITLAAELLVLVYAWRRGLKRLAPANAV